ncbi:glycosyltransferase family 4 protein [Candidatus Giovannonibacteria bacterium]|nr:glycosyltransferase family 4 protein [Candidatus Giovannonibacteria bacterium]
MALEKKPRVLMLYDFPVHGGGSGAYVKYLSLALHEKYGYDIGIAAPDTKQIHPNIPLYPIKLPQIPVYIGRPGLDKAKKYNELTPREIANIYHAFIISALDAVEQFKPDLIHVHHVLVNAWVARFIRSVRGTKYIATSHGSCLHLISRDKRYFRLTSDTLRAATAITVVSGDTRAKLLKMFGSYLSSKTRTIPGGIRLASFPEERPMQKIRKQFGFDHDKIALFTGRLISEKGVEYFVKAARKIKGKVVIAGDGPQRKRLEEMVKTMNLTNVRLIPFLHDYEEFVDLYYASDVFVSPAVWDEPLGLTIIEAMASKTPVIVTRKGGVTMAVKEGVNGLFVRPRNSTEIANAVNKLFENDTLRRRMGERARAVVEARFTWKKIAARFDKLYRGSLI